MGTRKFVFFIGLTVVMWLSSSRLFPIGIVGEVAASWTESPVVLQRSDPAEESILSNLGPLTLRSTRPIMSIGSIPISTNLYTSAIPDWPSALLFALSQSSALVLGWHQMMAGLLLFLIFGTLRRELPLFHRILLTLLLASDWTFLFYKRALGGTEVWLQLGVILCLLSALKFHRNEDGSVLLGWGMAIGLLAKVTFVFSLLPTLLALIWMRPQTLRLRSIAVPCILLLSLPLLTILAFSNTDIIVHSHDFFTLQWERLSNVFTATGPSRETSSNIQLWMLDPLPFFERAYQVSEIQNQWEWKALGWVVAVIVLLSQRTDTTLRWMSCVLAGQILLLGSIAKDLHHLAMVTPVLYIWLLFLVRHLPPKWTVLFAIPWLLGNLQILATSSEVIEKVRTPTFSMQQQQRLVDLLRTHNVQSILTMDYEIYGVLEAIAPDINVTHGWGAISHERAGALPGLLKTSSGGHLLVLRSSSGMIYNLRPSEENLRHQAKKAQVDVKKITEEGGSLWLYAVHPTQ